MSKPIHVIGISGSLRRASWNTGLLRAAGELLPEGMSLEIADLSVIPHYNQDLDAPDGPAEVINLRERIRAADALLIATPEYNHSIPGVLKNTIDWLSRPMSSTPLARKPVAILGAGGRFGTVRAQIHLRQITNALNMHTLNKPELMIALPWEKFDAEGNLHHEPTRLELRALLEALAAWTHRMRGE